MPLLWSMFLHSPSWGKEAPPPIPTREEIQTIVRETVAESTGPKITEEGLQLVSSHLWKVMLAGLFQAWYQWSDDAPNTTYGMTNPNAHHMFRLRRTELKLTGSFRDKLSFTVMIDPTKSLFQNQTLTDSAGNTVVAAQPRADGSILQDLVLTFRYIPYHDVAIGQMKMPTSLEGFGSSAKLAFAERAIVTRQIGERRDLGLVVTGKPIPQLHYELGIFNGEGPNAFDRGDFKDLVGRITIRPLKALHFAGWYHRGRIGDPESPNYRYGAEARATMGRFVLQGEYLRGSGGGCGTGMRCHGAYGFVSADVIKKERLGVQALGRFEFFDPDRGVGNDIRYASTLGVNLLLPDHHAKIQVNYTETEFEGPGRNHAAFLAVQFAL
ncbi:MAG: hypothetical protein HY696_13055 [Deltaproteobacteria bacterium]|nr:hypothetical protein [Deltaproteobacteria bacterium]